MGKLSLDYLEGISSNERDTILSSLPERKAAKYLGMLLEKSQEEMKEIEDSISYCNLQILYNKFDDLYSNHLN